MNPVKRMLPAVLLALATTTAFADHHKNAESAKGEWIQLFNGKDLDNWTPKFAGYKVGKNLHNIFRVEDGALCVNYTDFPGNFNGEYGHLFYKTPYSHYRIRAEYRMIGDQVSGGENWAFQNNGFMLHCQSPETMTIEQDFPASIEAQMLSAKPGQERSTGNICTPNTYVIIDGKPIKQHVIKSNGPSFTQDQWVTYEVEVHGDHFKHIVNGEVVHDYYARNDPFESDEPRTEGYIAIQAESAPTQFRKIELMVLAPE